MMEREANTEDLKQLAGLFNGYRVFYKKDSDLYAAERFLTDRLENKDAEIYVCEDTGGLLIGFVQLCPLFSSTRMKKLWLLNDLFVNPDARGKGVSIQLIERAKQLVKDTKACGMFLETGKSNIIGNNLYPKTGFALTEGCNYY